MMISVSAPHEATANSTFCQRAGWRLNRMTPQNQPIHSSMNGAIELDIADGSGNSPNGRCIQRANSTALSCTLINDGLTYNHKSGNSPCANACNCQRPMSECK